MLNFNIGDVVFYYIVRGRITKKVVGVVVDTGDIHSTIKTQDGKINIVLNKDLTRWDYE